MKIKHDITAATTTTTNGIRNNRNIDGNYNNKIIILTFGDIHKSQYTIAKPILDRYGFKSSFFVTCGFVSDINNKNAENNNNNELPRMTWNDILSLQQDGQDIESKGRTHRDLNLLAPNDLEFEIGGSKQCLENHGINSPNIFAVVHGDAWANPTVINMISKYYGFADNGFADLMFLHCDGYVAHKQSDCRMYDDSGTLTYANRYSIREDNGFNVIPMSDLSYDESTNYMYISIN